MRRFIRQRKQKVSTRALSVCAQVSLNWQFFCCSFFPPQYALICSLIPHQDNVEKPSEALEIPVFGLVSLSSLIAEMLIQLVSEAVHWVQNVWFWFLFWLSPCFLSGLKCKGWSNPSPLVLCSFLEHKQLLKNAQVELKKSKRKDYYKILGVDKNASEDEIKKAYRKRALMHHPGTHSSP